MAYDGLLTGIIARQLCEELKQAKIEKVQQPEPDEILLSVSAKSGRKKLLICVSPSGARVHFTELERENPKEAPGFCMLLRKHIQGGRISRVFQPGTERIICFDIETVNEIGCGVSKRLTAELMGKHSNLILINAETGKIIDSIKRISIDVNRYRQLLPGLVYAAPPAQDKLDFWTAGKDQLAASIEAFPAPELSGRIMGAVQGLGGASAEEFAAGIAMESAEKIVSFRDNIESLLDPAVYFLGEKPKEVHAIALRSIEEGCRKECFSDIGSALDLFYSSRAESNRVLQKKDALEASIKNLIDKQLLKKQRLLEEIRKSEDADIYRIKGELINANLHMIRPGERKVTLTSYYDGCPLDIELDEKLSPAKNAQAYFKKYTKAKGAKKEKLPQLDACIKDIDYLESVKAMASACASYEELELVRSELSEQGFLRTKKSSQRNAKFKPKPRRYQTKTGFWYAIGRSNTENDYITFKLGQKTDIWFHAKDIHGCHLVLFTEGAALDELDAETIYEAASAAAWFSKARASGNVPVDYVPLRYVKKPAGAKPGMVVFTGNRTVWIDPKQP